jgi:hypothetical protein
MKLWVQNPISLKNKIKQIFVSALISIISSFDRDRSASERTIGK